MKWVSFGEEGLLFALPWDSRCHLKKKKGFIFCFLPDWLQILRVQQLSFDPNLLFLLPLGNLHSFSFLEGLQQRWPGEVACEKLPAAV